MLKAIETVYQGYRFRSRLEARWAVFFDAMGIKWEYEKEGYDLDGVWYLPDFWLETVGMWAEIKPAAFTPQEEAKCKALARHTGRSCLMLDGLPQWRVYDGWDIYTDNDGDTQRSADGYAVDRLGYLLTDSHLHEQRFYFWPSEDETSESSMPDSVRSAILKARQARFEHGETPHLL